jgi:hypothetical protein
MEKINDEHLKLMYENVYDELNRSRDWPIKIMAFTSAAYLALFSLLKLDKSRIDLDCWIKVVITILLLGFWALTVKIIIKQHLNYLEYSNTRINLQKSIGINNWKIDNKEIFPPHWGDSIKINKWVRCHGWLFYAFYITIIALITILLIWNF